jgi:hypothetical protein
LGEPVAILASRPLWGCSKIHLAWKLPLIRHEAELRLGGQRACGGCYQISTIDKGAFMGLILLIILIVLLLGGLPTWPHSRQWGYGPSGILGLLLVVLLVLLLLNMIPWGFGPVVP